MLPFPRRRWMVRALGFRPRLEFLEGRLAPAIFAVTNTLDAGPGSLRQAILDANDDSGLDTIMFRIGNGVQTIAPDSVLPKITSPVIIDGTTQPGPESTPRIVLSGVNVGNNSGLWLTGGDSTIKGLVINGFKATGIILQTNGNNIIQGNYIGTDPTGTFAVPNGTFGVLSSQVSNTTIGGTTPGAGNVISGNYDAISLFQGSGHIVQGNYLGTNAAGTAIIGNDGGVDMYETTNCVIGGTASGAGNIISGNRNGIVLANGTKDNVIQGNHIGTDVTGTTKLGNVQDGILFTSTTILPYNNVIGGTTPEARNIISGNGWDGITILTGASNIIQGNYIGTDASGSASLGNGIRGVRVHNPSLSFDNVIGGPSPGAGNLISGNGGDGIYLDGDANQIQGNFIGTNALGTAAVGNGESGIEVQGYLNLIGGPEPGAGNIISGNGGAGIEIANFNTAVNLVQGNRIGTDITGMSGIANRWGIRLIQGATYNTIGGTMAATRNLISGNKEAGVQFEGPTTTDNVVQGNYIGTDINGTLPLSNSIGVKFFLSARQNTIGGTAAGAGNLISGNQRIGIFVSGAGSGANFFLGNRIGTDASGTQPLPNGVGIKIQSAMSNTIGGAASGAGNVIAFNVAQGVLVDVGPGNVIRRNSIFENGALGTDLINNGNHNQESPIITSVGSSNGITTVDGTFQSAANTTYVIEFFANTVCDPSGAGEGERFLGSMTLTTDSAGFAGFTWTAAIAIDPGQAVAATATDPSGNTSEFSNCTVALPGRTLDFRLRAWLPIEKVPELPARAKTNRLIPDNSNTSAYFVSASGEDDTEGATGPVRRFAVPSVIRRGLGHPEPGVFPGLFPAL